jgi:hypothetical protein
MNRLGSWFFFAAHFAFLVQPALGIFPQEPRKLNLPLPSQALLLSSV